MAGLHDLTNLNDITRLLHEMLAKERSVNAELEGLLQKRSTLEGSMVTLQSSTAEMLEVVRADAETLAAGVASTSQLSERVSSKVRELDAAQSHVRDTLAAINVIVDRSNCIYGVREALNSGNFEAAAGYVDTFMDLEDRYGPVRDGDGQQAVEQEQILMEAKQKLGGTVRQKLAGAIEARKHEDVVRFTRLYRPLRMQEEGLQQFQQYLCKLVAERAQEGYNILVEGGPDGGQDDFVEAATALFQDVAVAVEENESFLRSTFGAEALLTVIMALHSQCDASGAQILQRYASMRQLARLVKSINQGKSSSAGPEPSTPDPREVEGHLEEMLLLAQRAEEYNQFMLAKMADAVAPAPLSAAYHNAFRGGAFNVAVRELLNFCVAMEEFVMEEDIHKAMSIREHAPGNLTTSMVDDVFFVLARCGRRALGTASAACVCAVLGQANALLGSAYSPQLRAKLENAASKLLQAEAPHADDAVAAGTSAAATQAAYINDAEVSSWYVLKLRGELEEGATQVFGGAGEREQVRSVLADLAKTSADFGALASWALAAVAGAIASRLRPTLDSLSPISYEVLDFSGEDSSEAWVQSLAGALEAAMSPLQQLLTPKNYDALVSLVLTDVAKRVDAILAVKRFSQLGGLQLDRDIRALVAYAGELTQRPVRDKFAELTQKATLLSLESVDEVTEYWGEAGGPMGWRLSAEDVRHVLRQRTDFAPDEIAALTL